MKQINHQDDDILVCVYEDGTQFAGPYEQWRKEALQLEIDGDNEPALLISRLEHGETVMMGGGAQPLCRMWLECSPFEGQDHDKAQRRAESGYAQ